MIYISPNNEYPRHYGDIQLENPSWNLGDDLPEGWRAVSETEMPGLAENEIAEEGFPIEANGVMTQNWIIRSLTEKEIEQRNAPKTAKQKLISLGLTEFEVEALTRGLIR